MTANRASFGKSKTTSGSKRPGESIDNAIDLDTAEPNGHEDDTLDEIGEIKTRIVGTQFYSGIVNRNEKVMLLRQPMNRYDRNAIQVNNMGGIQVGHVPRDMAAVLAPLIDSQGLRIEGTITGNMGSYHTPLSITALCEVAAKDRLIASLKRLLHGQFTENSSIGQAPEQEKIGIDFDQLLEQNAVHVAASHSNALEKFGLKDAAELPEAAQPLDLITQLLPYQKQGLYWMKQCERPSLPEADSKEMVQFWIAKKDAEGIVYMNLASNYSTRIPPKLAHGGILSDDMGLGKTLQCVALILDNSKPLVSQEGGESNPTLIVCPVSVIGNWRQQFQEHVRPNRLSICIYHGNTRNDDIEYLKSFDVVITTYQIVTSEMKSLDPNSPAKQKSKKAKVSDTGVMNVNWNRVILDEGHVIKNKNSLQSKAVCQLKSKFRWILTGTPIQNQIGDLYPLVKFIKFAPFDEFDWWSRVIQRPLRRGGQNAMSKLRTLIKCVTLRRTKESQLKGKELYALPPIQYYLNKIPFSNPAEQELYQGLERESKEMFRSMLEADTLMENYGNILEVLTRLRQCCDHKDLVGRAPRSFVINEETTWAQRYASLSEKEKEKVVRVFTEAAEEDCCICLDTLKDMIVLRTCLHFFCKGCIEAVLSKAPNPSCPLCRRPANWKSDVIERPPEEAIVEDDDDATTDDEDEADAPAPSSKITALIEYLQASKRKDATVKSIVFSQWTTMLEKVGTNLKEAGIGFLRFDGAMTRQRREATLDQFQNDEEHPVLLCSLKAAALGLNLTRASQVFLLDPWWNPSVEDQAVDRVYRLGQKRPVTVVRLAIEGTIEERVMQLQEEKRALIKDAFGDRSKSAKEIREARFRDLTRLLGE